MQYIFGKQQTTGKKVDNQIAGVFKQKLKQQFCQLCQKSLATKVAFGKQVKPVFTCANCQLTAVGGSVPRLGPKSLITTQKFVEILTRQLISYQNNSKNPPPEHKKNTQNCQSVKGKVSEISSKITEQYKKMKKNIKDKHQQLHSDSVQQNTVPIFEEVNKLAKDKKLSNSVIEDGRMILKRSSCNKKGLHFRDEEEIEAANNTINDKFTSVKKQSKIRLKPLEELIDEINNMEI